MTKNLAWIVHTNCVQTLHPIILIYISCIFVFFQMERGIEVEQFILVGLSFKGPCANFRHDCPSFNLFHNCPSNFVKLQQILPLTQTFCKQIRELAGTEACVQERKQEQYL